MYLCLQVIDSILIFSNSQSAITVPKNPIFHDRTKHIDFQYHYVGERIQAREISLVYITSQKNVADILTKALACEKFENLRSLLFSNHLVNNNSMNIHSLHFKGGMLENGMMYIGIILRKCMYIECAT